MSRDDDQTNVFVRFKHHVDASVASGLNTMLGLPSPPSRPQPSSPPQTNTTSSNTSPFTGSSCPRRVADAPSAANFSWDALLLGLSPYSPGALRHLPPPVPNDLPPHLDSIFTWEDAFEDLLQSADGQPLSDITMRHNQRTLLRQMFPTGEPAWFWLQRLRSQGINTPDRSSLSAPLEPNQSQLRQELERRAADVWRSVAGESDDDMGAADFFHQLGHTFSQIEEAISKHGGSHNEANADGQLSRREPNHYDDLFSIAGTAFAEPQKTWDTFMKVITEHHNQSALEKPARDAHAEELPRNSQVVTQEEHVDRFGFLHTKVTVKTLDKDGNEIGNETNYAIRPADKTDSQATQSDVRGPAESGKKAGWFWK